MPSVSSAHLDISSRRHPPACGHAHTQTQKQPTKHASKQPTKQHTTTKQTTHPPAHPPTHLHRWCEKTGIVRAVNSFRMRRIVILRRIIFYITEPIIFIYFGWKDENIKMRQKSIELFDESESDLHAPTHTRAHACTHTHKQTHTHTLTLTDTQNTQHTHTDRARDRDPQTHTKQKCTHLLEQNWHRSFSSAAATPTAAAANAILSCTHMRSLNTIELFTAVALKTVLSIMF